MAGSLPPPALGGEDAAANSVEVALASLTACQVVTYVLDLFGNRTPVSTSLRITRPATQAT
jgi:hypothetical protein